MKNIILFMAILCIVCIIGFSPQAYSDQDGETLFYTKCGQCHSSGKAPVFAPVKYASVQWERFFKRNKHKRKEDISQMVAPEEMERIKTFLVEHAADSDLPIAAGLR